MIIMLTMEIDYSKLLKQLPELAQYYKDLSTSDIFYELSDYIDDFDNDACEQQPLFLHSYKLNKNLELRLDNVNNHDKIIMRFTKIGYKDFSELVQFLVYCLWSDVSAMDIPDWITEDDFYDKYTSKIINLLN